MIIRKLSVFLAALVMFLLMPVAASASNYGFEQGDYVNLNGYIFKVLDPEIDYLYYPKNLENRAFDTNNTKYFNPSDSTNIAYYLNTTFYENLGSIKPFIKTVEWNTGAISSTSNINTVFSEESKRKTSAKVSLISVYEYLKYKNIAGNPTHLIWTRTPTSKGNGVYRVKTTGSISWTGNIDTIKSAISPVLQLNHGLTILGGTGTGSDPYLLNTEPISEISNLSLLKTNHTEILIMWSNPTESNFSHLNIYRDGKLLKSNYNDVTYLFTGLNPSQEYKFTIKAVDKYGIESMGKSIVVSTDDMPLLPEINNLKETVTHDRVKLSWQNPKSEFFNHVKIYRKTDEPETVSMSNGIEEFILGKKVSAAETEDFDPMFETNGTYWNDLTVEPETSYDYKLTTVNIAGAESEGEIIEVTTLSEPLPEMGGEEIERDENGDFLLSWTSPTEGQVKILIDGTEYTTVDASLQQYVIPKDDMVYDLFGKPKVQLVAISESGKEGTPTKPPVDSGNGPIGADIPFSATELLKTVMSLISFLGSFILLSLAIHFTPRLIKLIRTAVVKFKEGKIKL